MGCGSSKSVHPPTQVGDGEFSGRGLSRKASSVNRRGQSRKKSMKMNAHKALATLAGESFYVMEVCYRELPGVIKVKPGHCTHKGISLEVVQVTFDANKLSYEQLLKAHFNLHDPTAPQKDDSKIQSVVFAHDAEQSQQAKSELENIQKKKPVTLRTEVTDFASFLPDPAAANYYTNNFNSDKAQKEIKPKLDKFKSSLKDIGMSSLGLTM